MINHPSTKFFALAGFLILNTMTVHSDLLAESIDGRYEIAFMAFWTMILVSIVLTYELYCHLRN